MSPRARARWRDHAHEALRRGLALPGRERLPASLRLTFVEFVRRVKPSFRWSRHNELLANKLQQVADGLVDRLMIFMPPRHGKSELVSRLFPAYLLYLFPALEVGLASYSASLAEQLSADARGYYLQSGRRLDTSTHSKSDWRTLRGGRMWAEGVGGSMTGKGFAVGIVDDPFKGAQDSGSESQREKVKEWFRAVWYTRQAPQAAMVIVNTRWHEDDLSGWLLAEEWEQCREEDGMPEGWHVVSLAAVRDLDAEEEWPPSCTVEPDWRQHGEALDPSRYSIEKLRRIERRVQGHWWTALYQQRPSAKGGTILKTEWFGHRLHISQIPPMARIVLGVDPAWTKSTSADFTHAQPLGVDAWGRYYLFRPYRDQQEATEILGAIAARAVEVGATRIGVESVAGQKALAQHLRKEPILTGRTVVEIRRGTQDKEALAREWSPLAQQGLVTLVVDGTGWEVEYLRELAAFPRGRHDDAVDGTGIAFATIQMTSEEGAAAGGSREPLGGIAKKLRN